jgi:uncharacterized membrane protein YjgN (DUF898 family)
LAKSALGEIDMSDQGGFGAAAGWSGAGQPVQKLEYDGRIGVLYGIFIKNLLLNIITLSIYRFWGKTNLRRYAWSHMTLQGHRFEYTGRGGELFIGFLIVIGFYIVFFLSTAIVGLVAGDFGKAIGPLLLAVFIPYLIFVAQYAAQNYRLTRTLWCGIRGGMTGSAWRYGVKAYLFALLSVITLNLAMPWTSMRLTEDRFNHSYFGNAKASLQAPAGPLYPTFILGFVLSIIGVVLLVAIGYFVVMPIIHSTDLAVIMAEMNAAEEAGRRPDLSGEQMTLFYTFLIALLFAFYLGMAFIAIAAFAPYMAAQFRQIANNLTIADVRFASQVTAMRYIGLWMGNLLWVVLTLGLGFPVAVHRTLKFFADRVELHGTLDTARLAQTTLDQPKFGEGLLEAFDPGFL